MKKERYIVEIEMPDGDVASSTYIHDVIQSDCDIEDEDRWKVSVKEYWKPSEEQIKAVKEAACYSSVFSEKTIDNLIALSKQLKKLREE